ncbi:hypothetical protein [Paragemmobacter straminiformis]|uniref:Uncharacterized protein n=1 Tax=Paragemmobacter straminiformis TaxID=2045119 RepID=A0A842IBI9_9RHOB|nr:hypothetical protein [Gemmobacter straminiformis]MBC2837045.1 hypothetical protein [Gemmobacter straminiformis]
MTDPLRIPLTQDRAIWLFAIDLPDEQVDAFLETGLAAALGAAELDPAQVEVIDTDTIRLIGLATYLTEANGMDDATVAPDAVLLDSLKGRLLMVFRAALGTGGTHLSPQAPLRFIGHYTEPATGPILPMPATASAKGVLEGPRGKPVSDAAMSGRIAMAVLVFLFIFTAVFIWMAS